ncbi:MAG: hypothetical protein ACXAAQ_14785 [Candidatus Thorarchaeota archaeon]
MPAIHKSRSRQLVALSIITLLFAPMVVFVGGAKSRMDTETTIGPNLADVILSSDADEVIPIVAQFPEGMTPDSMVEEIRNSNLASIEIRYAFQLISTDPYGFLIH